MCYREYHNCKCFPYLWSVLHIFPTFKDYSVSKPKLSENTKVFLGTIVDCPRMWRQKPRSTTLRKCNVSFLDVSLVWNEREINFHKDHVFLFLKVEKCSELEQFFKAVTFALQATNLRLCHTNVSTKNHDCIPRSQSYFCDVTLCYDILL